MLCCFLQISPGISWFQHGFNVFCTPPVPDLISNQPLQLSYSKLINAAGAHGQNPCQEQGLNTFPPLPCFGKGGGTVDRFVVYYPHSSIEPYLPNVFSSAVCPVPAVPRFSGFSVTQAVSDAICLHPPLKGTSQWHTIPNSGCFPALTHTQPYPR